MKNLKTSSKLRIGSMGLLLLSVVAGCGDGGGEAQLGTLHVSLTDAPACGFDAVNVTVEKVRVHQSSSADETAAGWATIALDPPRKINLLTLNDPTQPNFALESLGETPLEAGHYTQLRLVLVGDTVNGQPPFHNSVVLSSQPNTEIELETPSALRSGIKLIHQFTVNAGHRTDLLLDFDACKSIVRTGNGKYKLKPVIRIVPYELNGIEGFVDPARLGDHVVVSAQVNGEIVRTTVPNVNPLPNPNRGKFFLAHLPAGVNYDVVFTADNRATAVITGVPVPSSISTTIVSTQGAPILLPASLTNGISGSVFLTPRTDDEPVLLTAKQTFNNVPGTIVTVHSQPAVLVDGAPFGDFTYTLILPIGAPWLGAYTTSLPIVLTEHTLQPPVVAGRYTLQASASGYASQSISKDISGGNATQDFSLIP